MWNAVLCYKKTPVPFFLSFSLIALLFSSFGLKTKKKWILLLSEHRLYVKL